MQYTRYLPIGLQLCIYIATNLSFYKSGLPNKNVIAYNSRTLVHMMDFCSELELMAANASTNSEEISNKDVTRWHALFGYTDVKAESSIKEHRANLARPRASDEHWAIVRSEMATLGHDKESYEYSLHLQHVKYPKGTTTPVQSEYLLKLEGPLATPIAVREAAKLQELPKVIPATDESDSNTSFIIVNGAVKDAITVNFTNSSFTPTFIRLSKAAKALSSTSAYPTLGIDFTLPQFRPSKGTTIYPKQDDYTVWYFFYGTLAEPDRLMRLFDLVCRPTLRRASVNKGVIKTWAGKYRALVNAVTGTEASITQGWTYLLTCREHEEALQYYETEKYEVVRCEICVDGDGVQKGLTFRFVDASLLA